MACQVFDLRRATGDFGMGLPRVELGEPSVSDVCELGRAAKLLRLEDFGEAREFPLCRVLTPDER